MSRIAVLLNGAIRNDSRVIRLVRFLSRHSEVHLYYVNGTPEDGSLFCSNVTLHSTPFDPNSLSFLDRHFLIHRQYAFLEAEVLKSALEFDIIHANDYPTVSVGLRLAKHYKARLVYDAHELFLQTLNQNYPVKVPVFRSIVQQLVVCLARLIGRGFEKRALRGTDLFITVGSAIMQEFHRQYRIGKHLVVRNCPELGQVETVSGLRASLGLAYESKLVLYQGVFNAGRCLEQLVLSGHYLNDDTAILLLGRGPLQDHLRRLVESEGLTDKVFMMDFVPPDNLLKITAQAQLGVVLLEDLNLSKMLAAPNKMYEYMKAGLPVLATKQPESVALVESAGNGLLIDTVEPSEIGKCINGLLQNSANLEKMSAAGFRAFRDQLNWEYQAAKLESFYPW